MCKCLLDEIKGEEKRRKKSLYNSLEMNAKSLDTQKTRNHLYLYLDEKLVNKWRNKIRASVFIIIIIFKRFVLSRCLQVIQHNILEGRLE